MNSRRTRIILTIVLTLLLGLAAGGYMGTKWAAGKDENEVSVQSADTDGSSGDSGKSSGKNMKKIDQAYNLIKKHYVRNVSDQNLTEGAIQGMLKMLDDPYSEYLDAEKLKQFNEQIESSFEGIGAEVSMEDNKVTIVAPIKGSPAEKAGLRPKDKILKIDGKSIEGLDLNEAVSKIRGEKGTKVKLEIERPGTKKPFTKEITRDKIPVETVYGDMKQTNGKKTGVIKLTSFSEHTADDFLKELDKLEKDGMQGLVIDVRGNPGGLLQSVEAILDVFITKDKPYLQIENRKGDKEPRYSKLDKKKDYPINILTDEGSASASEILAVAFKENGYDTVGVKSFGKGTVQQAVALGDGSEIKLTLFKWLSPDGNWIHKKGVKPTIEQKQPAYYYANPIDASKPLVYDQTGDSIENVQIMLTGLGYEPKRTDGYFSKETEQAVKAFQQAHKLKADGKVDSKTAETIEAEVVAKIRSGKDDKQLKKALDSLYK